MRILIRASCVPAKNLTEYSFVFQIIVLKKSIANYEDNYEARNGHPLTPSDRITDVQLTQMYENLRQLQVEKRCIKTDPVEYALKLQAAKAQKERDDKLDAALKSNKSMVDVVNDIEEVSSVRVRARSEWDAFPKLDTLSLASFILSCVMLAR